MDKQIFLAVAFGGGRNGALLLGLYEQGVKPDVITFANTGRLDRTHGEKPSTYEHVDRMSAWCESHFGVGITEVHKDSKYPSLYDNCLETSKLPSPAYGMRTCSEKWKIKPQNKFMNRYQPARDWWGVCDCCGEKKQAHVRSKVGSMRVLACRDQSKGGVFQQRKITKAIGYDAGESWRAKVQEDDKYTHWYPLIEWGWGLEECIKAYVRHGLPVPRKSACYFCPSSKKSEVVWLYENHPELYWSAVEMEDRALDSGELVTVKGLGRDWSWRELIQSTLDQRAELPEAPQMACACFDSEDEE